MITLNVNNESQLCMFQPKEDGMVYVSRLPKNEPAGQIPAGDMVILLNYYRHVKDNDIHCDFVNPGGKNSMAGANGIVEVV